MNSKFDEIMLRRCLELASNGLGTTYPNPLVGCVIVHNGKIISEAWHRKAGSPHAEVLAISEIEDKSILKHCTLYVSLEPCSHHGKTPPCSDLIIKHQIPRVVIGALDSSDKVNGRGIQKLKEAGINVSVGVLEKESLDLNKRFFTFHQKKRPFVILKWAQTADGFMADKTVKKRWITNKYSKQLVHLWRTQEQAILVGTNTAEVDNPQLSAREWKGNNPLRITIDKQLKLSPDLYLLDNSLETIILGDKEEEREKLKYIKTDFKSGFALSILNKLYELEIQSVIIEGGRKTLDSFIEEGLWDEARIFTSEAVWGEGIESPKISGQIFDEKQIGTDKLKILIPFA